MDDLIMSQSPLNTQQLLAVVKRSVAAYYGGDQEADQIAVQAYQDLLSRKLLLQAQLDEVNRTLIAARTFDKSFGQYVKIIFAHHPAAG
jgi:hypothetical protein